MHSHLIENFSSLDDFYSFVLSFFDSFHLSGLIQFIIKAEIGSFCG